MIKNEEVLELLIVAATNNSVSYKTPNLAPYACYFGTDEEVEIIHKEFRYGRPEARGKAMSFVKKPDYEMNDESSYKVYNKHAYDWALYLLPYTAKEGKPYALALIRDWERGRWKR